MEMSVVVNGELYFKAAPMIRGIEDGVEGMRSLMSSDEILGYQTILETMHAVYAEEAEHHGLDTKVPY